MEHLLCIKYLIDRILLTSIDTCNFRLQAIFGLIQTFGQAFNVFCEEGINLLDLRILLLFSLPYDLSELPDRLLDLDNELLFALQKLFLLIFLSMQLYLMALLVTI